jgi:hypothetical protein
MLVPFTSTLLAALLSFAPATTQTAGAATSGEAAPAVFIDCAECDYDYMRTEITFVTFVTERTAADVHVLVTSQPTAAGGTSFTFDFIGQGRFRDVDATLRYVRGPTDTADELRRGLIGRLKLGLVRYAADTSAADRIDVVTSAAGLPNHERDPWNYWVFRSTIRGTFSQEASSGSRLLGGSFSVDRTTDESKFVLAVNGEYSADTFRVTDVPLRTATRRTFAASTLTVKTVGSRWATGVKTMAGNSSYLNQNLAIRVAPGVEFNVFPYAESTRRRLTIQYTAGPNRFRYVTRTVFDETSETRVDETVLASLDLTQPWGSISTAVEGSHYFPAADLYRVVAFGQADIRVYKGLSVNLMVTGARIHDQLYLPKEQVTIEDVLVRARQFATSHRFLALLGFTYSFGSVANSTVNPRFMGSPGGYLLVQ